MHMYFILVIYCLQKYPFTAFQSTKAYYGNTWTDLLSHFLDGYMSEIWKKQTNNIFIFSASFIGPTGEIILKVRKQIMMVPTDKQLSVVDLAFQMPYLWIYKVRGVFKK